MENLFAAAGTFVDRLRKEYSGMLTGLSASGRHFEIELGLSAAVSRIVHRWIWFGMSEPLGNCHHLQSDHL